MTSRDYPKLLPPEVQEAIRDHDLAEAVRLYEAALEGGGPLALWAELLDELAARGHAWREWAEHTARGEAGLEQAVYFLVLGIEALQAEAYERASYFLNRCAEVAPTSPVPLAYIGILYESQGCPTEALATYERCLALDPELFSVLNAAGNLYHELGFYAQSIAHYRRAYPLLHEPCNQAILLGNLGNSLRALRRHDEAIAAYTEAIALDPGQPASPVALAETLFEVQRYENVITCLSDLLQIPDFDEWPEETQRAVYDLLARAYRQVRVYPASLMFLWLRNGARLDEEDREGVSLLLKTLFGWAIDEPGQPVAEFLLAKLNRQLGYTDAALHHAKRALKAQPERAEHFIELGATLLLQGKTPVALEAFEEAELLAPDRADVQTFLAMGLWENDPESARAALVRAARLEPNQALHHVDLAFLHQTTGDVTATQAAFQRALLLNSEAPVLYGPHGPVCQRGCYSDVIEPFLAENATSPAATARLLTAANFLILSHRRDAARKALHRLLSEHPTQLDALRTYAWLLTSEGWSEEALSIWRRVLLLAPDDDISRYFALSCQAMEGSEGKQQALRELDKALAARPHYHLGRMLLAKLQEPAPEALAHLETLCLQLPNVYSPWYWRAQSHQYRREFDAALAHAERAILLNAGFAPAHKLKAQALHQLGRTAEAHMAMGSYYLKTRQDRLARAELRSAVLASPDDEAAQAALARAERRLARLAKPAAGDLYRLIDSRFRV